MTEQHRKGLSNAYIKAGRNYLAYRLRRVFNKIENEEDRILHNDMMCDLDILIASHIEEFLKNTSDTIILLASKESINGTKEKKKE